MQFLEPNVYETIDQSDQTDPVWSANPQLFLSSAHRELQTISLTVLNCPSDSVRPGTTSFRCNLGVSVQLFSPLNTTIEPTAQQGAFVNGRALKDTDFHDGLSKTAFYAERVLGDFDPDRYDAFRDIFADGQIFNTTPTMLQHCEQDATVTPPSEYSFLGGSWLLGGNLNSWYYHILPPNSKIPDCAVGQAAVDGGPGIITARSFHPDFVHVCMGDGSVHAISGHIDNAVWHALGTRSLRDSTAQ